MISVTSFLSSLFRLHLQDSIIVSTVKCKVLIFPEPFQINASECLKKYRISLRYLRVITQKFFLLIILAAG